MLSFVVTWSLTSDQNGIMIGTPIVQKLQTDASTCIRYSKQCGLAGPPGGP